MVEAVPQPETLMEYKVLGPLAVVRDGEPIDVGSLQQRALLALLLINAKNFAVT